MERDDVKKIVYECAAKQFYNAEDQFYAKMSQSPDDGQDLLIYNEVGFDSLDIVEFIMSLESRKDLYVRLPDNLFDLECTFRKVIDYIWEDNKNE